MRFSARWPERGSNTTQVQGGAEAHLGRAGYPARENPYIGLRRSPHWQIRVRSGELDITVRLETDIHRAEVPSPAVLA